MAEVPRKRSGGLDLRVGIGLALTALLVCLIWNDVIPPGSVALGLGALIWAGVVVSYGQGWDGVKVLGYAALFLGICVVAYGLIPELLIKLRWSRLFEQIWLLLRWKFCSAVQAARVAGRRLKYT
jgi:hypothetical protein